MGTQPMVFRKTSCSGLGWILGLRSRRGDRRLRPILLELEHRRLLSGYTVNSTADGNVYGTLRTAIAEANLATGAFTISFDPTVFSTPQTITLAGSQLELKTSASVTISGPTAGVTISGAGMSRVFQVDNGVRASITGLTFTKGLPTSDGGGVLNYGTLNLNDCSISGNSVGYNFWGGGLANVGGTVTLSNCTVSGNSYCFGGGVANLNNGMITLTGCTISGNKGRDGGGLINYKSQMSLTDCIVTSNVGGAFDGGNGGGLDTSGTINLTNCVVSNNAVIGGTGSGGGLNGTGTINMSNCSFTGNSAGGDGGGLSAASGTATLTDCTFTGNKARDSGGGNWGYGGGLDIGSRLTASLIDCTIAGNTAVNRGGGLFFYGATVNLTDCTISGNAAQRSGGLRQGGSGSATLIDCTLSGNSATHGGGLQNYSSTNLTACTVSGNSASNGGGLGNYGTAVLTDTIVAGNTVPNSSNASDISGNVSGSNNLIGPGGSGGLVNGAEGNIILGDPSSLLLAPLGYYGGPTQTMALLPGSAAIGKGTKVSGVTTDQRGEPLDSPVPDIGAFQSQPDLVVNTTSDSSYGISSPPSELSLRQAVGLANFLGGRQTITFDPTAFATAETVMLTQGDLELSDSGGPLTIDGPRGGLTVSGGGASRVFVIDSGTTAAISGLTITGGSASTDGGGVYDKGTTTLTDCTISGNSAKGNGGGLGGNGTTSLTDCTISGNSAATGGGLVIVGTTSLTDCTISGNSAVTGGGLCNKGTATLQDTIVAGNTGSGGSASDIEGSVANSSSYNLIGTGGSGGLTNGAGHNIVLTTLAGLGLAPLGQYGGPTETMALLPGSSAIGVGTAVNGISTDQRGAPRSTAGAVDIGAFQDQDYTVAVLSGSPQSTLVNHAFGSPLVAKLTENYLGTPLQGVTIGFSAPSSGANATLGATSATTNASGQASVMATAKATAGRYAVTASASGVTSSASFSLTNQIQPSFSGLTSPVITYGTASVNITGTLAAAGPQYPLVGDTVTVTLAGVGHTATLGAGGSFTVTIPTSSLNASSTAYTVSYAYMTDGIFLGATGSSQLTINRAALTITAKDLSKTYGQALTFAGTEFTASGLVNGDSVTSVTLTSPGAAATAGVAGSPYAITASDAVGSGLSNYIPTYFPGRLTVNPKPLTITAVGETKVYDGTSSATAVPAITIGGLANGDTADFTEIYITKNMGTGLTLTPSGAVDDGNGGRNYKYTFVPVSTGTITPAALTITATGDTKVYDGTVASSKAPTHGMLYGSDTVAGLTQAFASKDVLGANASKLVVTGYAVDDGDGGKDYTVATQTASGTITPAALAISATSDTKVYDGTTASSKAPTHGALYGSDTVTGLIQAFTSKNVLGASGSTLVVTGYTVDDGDGGKDYMVATQNASGTITPAALTITATGDTKVYDGTVAPSKAPTHGMLYGSDTVAGLTQAFASKDVLGANASKLVVTGYAVDDGDGGKDYTVATQTASGTITPAALTITANSQTKVYGVELPALTATYSGLVAGDRPASLTTPPTLTTTATPSSPVVAGGYPITVSGAVDPDYIITQAPGTLTVTPATPTITVTAPGGTFDTSPFAANVTLSGKGKDNRPAATLENVSPELSYYVGSDTSGTDLGSTPPSAPGTYTVVAAFPGSADYATTQSLPITFRIVQAQATISLTSSGGSSVYGQSVTFTATVTGAGTPTGSVTFTDGGAMLGTVDLDSSGKAALTTSSLVAGSQTIIAIYSGSTDFASAASAPTTVAVAKAGAHVVLETQSVHKKKKVVSLTLDATIAPLASGAVVPTGTVTFELMHKKHKVKVLGTAPLRGGSATLTVKPKSVLKKSVTILYRGDADFQASSSTASVSSRGTAALVRLIPTPVFRGPSTDYFKK